MSGNSREVMLATVRNERCKLVMTRMEGEKECRRGCLHLILRRRHRRPPNPPNCLGGKGGGGGGGRTRLKDPAYGH